MAEWKLILGSKKEKVKDISTQIERDVENFYIVTNDSKQLILSKYRINNDKVDKMGNEVFDLELNGNKYVKVTGWERYGESYDGIIRCYLRELQLKPNKDITEFFHAVELMNELQAEAKRVYGIMKGGK